MNMIKNRWDKEVADALKNGKRYNSAKTLIRDIKKI